MGTKGWSEGSIMHGICAEIGPGAAFWQEVGHHLCNGIKGYNSEVLLWLAIGGFLVVIVVYLHNR